MKICLKSLVILVLGMSFVHAEAAEKLNGAGATFPYPVYSAWAFDYNKVTGVQVKNVKTGQTRTLDCAGVFVAVGHVPNTALFKGVVEMDDAGYILTQKGAATNVPGVFVAGDCSDRVYRQAITAAGMGCAAAIDAERYLASLPQ